MARRSLFTAMVSSRLQTPRSKVKTSGRALPEVSEVYQEAAVEFIGYLTRILDYVIT